MENYVIVIKKGTGYKVGRNRYNQEDAIKRQGEMKASGINCKVMTENEAFGV